MGQSQSDFASDDEGKKMPSPSTVTRTSSSSSPPSMEDLIAGLCITLSTSFHYKQAIFVSSQILSWRKVLGDGFFSLLFSYRTGAFQVSENAN
ncbi:hypothetical protein M5K25_017506 [Dendrobium thyrsiflorum]|uniref:Uncharacterized protein n=1 Tax=Dendrobium thyrsiflorum TaxID=117978 RepID=A0ABD0UMN5_DENTH